MVEVGSLARRLSAGIGLGLLCLVTQAGRGWAAPANDRFADAMEISGATNYIVVSNVAATSEPGEPAHAFEPPAHSVWWRWRAPFTGSFTVNTRGSSFDTVLAVYQGTALATLSVIASNDDQAPFSDLWSEVLFRAYAGESFYIAVDGAFGATGTISLAIGRAGYPVQPWQANDLEAGQIRSTDFTNKVVLIDFWETTCGACVEELPALRQLQSSLEWQGFTLIGLAGDPSPQMLEDFLSRNGIPYPVAMSNPGVEQAVGGALGFPTKYLIDREGRVVAHYLGANTLAFYQSIVLPLMRSAPVVRAQIAQQNGSVTLSWPGTEFGYLVESKTNLSSGNWLPVSAPIQMTNGQHAISIPADGSRQFFRLNKTSPNSD
jgi:thiol-disulfide isomerase/thioredoxin